MNSRGQVRERGNILVANCMTDEPQTPLSVLAFEDIDRDDLVIVVGSLARIFRHDGPLSPGSLLATALEDIKKGKHGHVRPID